MLFTATVFMGFDLDLSRISQFLFLAGVITSGDKKLVLFLLLLFRNEATDIITTVTLADVAGSVGLHHQF